MQSGQEDPRDHEEAPSAYIPSERGSSKGYAPKAAFNLNWPLNYVKINQHFKPKKKRRPHLGVDFAGTKGTAIFSSHEGLVIYAGRAFKGFGKMVIVEYDDQWATLYAHLDKITVRTGQIVEQGQTLGKMGRTGRATGVHLHFELLHNQRPVDPIPLLNEVQRLVDREERKRSPTSL
ncbi:MAG: M23 family metallopeptidase [Bdellovibrionales bacterium]